MFVVVCEVVGKLLEVVDVDCFGLVMFMLDDFDWEDEICIVVEECVGFSLDVLIGMEVNFCFVGLEIMEMWIFGWFIVW